MQNLKKISTNNIWSRAGFTLIEALIAITMTLIIMLALAQGFKQLSYDISQGRARLTLSDQLRGVSEILRNDLAGLTVDVDPTSKAAKSGYFMYYEGPIADHHPVTVPINNLLATGGGTIEQNLSTSKYGDFDDILMFTARSQGDWFRGKVPLAIVKGATLGAGYVPVPSDWTTSVVVASEYAEIAYFMVPKIVPTLNAAPTPYGEYVANADLTLPFVDNDSAVNPGAIVATGNAIPDQFSLCRRVLLILPSLNMTTTGQLCSAGGSPPAVKLQASPVSVPMNLNASAESSRLALANAYQRCDLSVRRSIPTAPPPPLDPTNNSSLVYANVPIVANSLESLANPLNRFAHVTLPGGIIGIPSGDAYSRSMPILSLSAAIPLQNYAVGTNVLLPARSDLTFPECGFIRPEFLKRKFDPATGAVAVTPDPVAGGLVEVLSNEEVLATNCVGFDLKGFDPIARLLYNKGPDAGVRGQYSAEGAGIADGADVWADLGMAGSDDLVVSPSDPGYLTSIQYTIGPPAIPNNMPPASLAQVTASQGAFVDLGWAFKTPFVPSAALGSFFRTNLSGVEGVFPSVSLRKSGRVVGGLNAGAPPPSITAQVYQPCFDSYTDAFERDGFRQWDRVHTATVPPTAEGTYFFNGLYFLAGSENPILGNADLASNGLDDNNGVGTAGEGIADDYTEQDSSPPISSPMSSIQALIRLEDAPTNVIQQIAVTQDLLTH